jgi:hypothetical protein
LAVAARLLRLIASTPAQRLRVRVALETTDRLFSVPLEQHPTILENVSSRVSGQVLDEVFEVRFVTRSGGFESSLNAIRVEDDASFLPERVDPVVLAVRATPRGIRRFVQGSYTRPMIPKIRPTPLPSFRKE